MVADFRSEYHEDLNDCLDSRTWFWFTDLIAGLMSANTRLARHFAD